MLRPKRLHHGKEPGESAPVAIFRLSVVAVVVVAAAAAAAAAACDLRLARLPHATACSSREERNPPLRCPGQLTLDVDNATSCLGASTLRFLPPPVPSLNLLHVRHQRTDQADHTSALKSRDDLSCPCVFLQVRYR
ncbi:hypothetical protein CSOJ01_04164 [Colletotrichum sojae]|uniref:Uncharacterized protein n=1 Tax=Colletotrichum sojae TaxID=2175907 RepID=A0A8H6JK39_9PEZI|nr:hypothetical protein CSOJ01_04164 [Colletotrichum sojae]